MNLTFNSIHELDEFLRWADLYRTAGTPEPVVPGGSVPAADGGPFVGKVTTTTGADSDAQDRCAALTPVSYEGPSSISVGTSGASEGAPAEPAKRKRRTKAEIEADNAADAAADAERAAHAAQEAAEVAAKGANPFEQPAAGGTEAPAAPADSAPTADGGTESDAEEVVTPFQHLTRAREFIAKHGMPKYNETFAKASLDPNVMAYTAYQRALHMTAMDELDKA